MAATWIKLNDNDDINGVFGLALDSNNGLRISEVNRHFPEAASLKYKDEDGLWKW
jgi:hypothetical protein